LKQNTIVYLSLRVDTMLGFVYMLYMYIKKIETFVEGSYK